MKVLYAALAIVGTLTAMEGPLRADWADAIAAYSRGDFVTAFKETLPIAEKGDAKAQFTIGFMYHRGKGITQSNLSALKWYGKAAEQGNADAQNNLGHMYRLGEGVPQDDDEAVKWYRKAADQGNADAQNNLKLMHDYGRVVPEDYVESYESSSRLLAAVSYFTYKL